MSAPASSSSAMAQKQINKFSGKPYSATYFRLRNEAANLPVRRCMQEIMHDFKNHQVVILVGKTGSGKTTQLVQQMLEDDPDVRVVLTQNRRLAANSVASRIADELDVRIGEVVGLQYRGENSTSGKTRLRVVTDGTLLSMAKNDPRLSKVDVVVVDEAHAHTIATDFVMGLAKLALQGGRLKVVIMSATIDQAMFLAYFPGACLREVPGRAYAVRTHYLKDEPSDYATTLVDTIVQVHLTGRPGNILVFVSGEREISDAMSAVQRKLKQTLEEIEEEGEPGTLACFKLYSNLPVEQQDLTVDSVAPQNALDGNFGRKVIFATNIAETSITLRAVTHVIDSCRAKSKIWNIATESWTLEEHLISKAQVAQRSGRAGRTSEGESYVMMTEYGYLQLPEHPIPDMLKGDMVRECLQLLAMGHNPVTFPYIHPPPSETIAKAMGTLSRLGLLVGSKLNPRGMKVESLGVDAQLGVALIASVAYGCTDEFISIVAMVEATESGDVFRDPGQDQDLKKRIQNARVEFKHLDSDHLTLFDMYMAWRQACANRQEAQFIADRHLRVSVFKAADASRKRLLLVMHDAKITTAETSADVISSMHGKNRKDYYLNLIRCLAAGNFLRVAKRNPATNEYETVPLGIEVKLQNSHNFGGKRPGNEWVIYSEYREQPAAKVKDAIRVVTAIAPQWLFKAAAAYWCDPELMPPGHTKDGIIQVLTQMTGMDASSFMGGMPEPSLGAIANLTIGDNP